MTDGNKESAKELLSTFRTLIPTSLAILLYITSARKSSGIGLLDNPFHLAAVIMLSLSIISAIYVCLLIIPKLEKEDLRIIYETDVKISSSASLMLFAVSCIVIVAAL